MKGVNFDHVFNLCSFGRRRGEKGEEGRGGEAFSLLIPRALKPVGPSVDDQNVYFL